MNKQPLALQTTLVKDRIQSFYAKMSFALRELEAYKKSHGFYTAGISCMRKKSVRWLCI